MSKVPYDGQSGPQFEPLSPWKYVGISILFALPVIGIIFAIIFACSDKNINRQNFAKAFWLDILIAVIITIILVIICVALGIDINEITGSLNI